MVLASHLPVHEAKIRWEPSYCEREEETEGTSDLGQGWQPP